MGSPGVDLIIDSPETLALILEDVCTFRQLRYLAKRNKVRQYSYLNKRGLSVCLAYAAENKIRRQRITKGK
jgi:hypothetical protein